MNRIVLKRDKKAFNVNLILFKYANEKPYIILFNAFLV